MKNPFLKFLNALFAPVLLILACMLALALNVVMPGRWYQGFAMFNLDPANTNTIAADLNLNTLLNEAIFAFKRAILNMRVFATVFSNVVLKGTDKIAVPYYPLEGSASRDFNPANGYVFDDTTNTQARLLGGTDNNGKTLWKRKYQPLHITGEEFARLPMLNAQTVGRLKGEKLAYDVIQDILSIVLNANFPNIGYTGAPGTMDSDTIIDLRTAITKLNWPSVGRGLLTNPDVDGSLLKDNAFKQAFSIGTAEVIQEGTLPRIFGFDYATSNAIPSNGENLTSMATFMSAILIAFSPIEPPPSVRARMTAYEIVDDSATGVAIEFREWGDPKLDTDFQTLECNYVYAPGEANAILRVKSA